MAYTHQPATDYPLAVLISRWMTLVGDSTLEALWQDDWLPLLTHLVRLTRRASEVDAEKARSMAGCIGRSLTSALAQRPKLRDSVPVVCDWVAWARGEL